MRPFLLVLLLVLSAMPAAAAGALPPTVGSGSSNPHTVTTPLAPPPGSPPGAYYARVTVDRPDPPTLSTGDDGDDGDCASGSRPATLRDAASGVLAPFVAAPPHPLTFHSTAAYTPACVASPAHACVVASPLPCGDAPVLVSYDVGTGTYYVAFDPAADGILLPVRALEPLAPLTGDMTVLTGKVRGGTGVSYQDDCEDCPPVVCC